MRLLLRIFATLDLIALVFMSMQLWYLANHFNEIMDNQLLLVKVETLLMFPMFLLILVGGLCLYRIRKLGLFLYYVQFPFRLYLLVFSIGFITLLPEAFGYYEGVWFDILLGFCIIAEFIRLFLTIWVYRKHKLFLP